MTKLEYGSTVMKNVTMASIYYLCMQTVMTKDSGDGGQSLWLTKNKSTFSFKGRFTVNSGCWWKNKTVRGCFDEDKLTMHGGDSQHDQNGHACTLIGDGGRFLSQAGFSGMSFAQRWPNYRSRTVKNYMQKLKEEGYTVELPRTSIGWELERKISLSIV